MTTWLSSASLMFIIWTLYIIMFIIWTLNLINNRRIWSSCPDCLQLQAHEPNGKKRGGFSPHFLPALLLKLRVLMRTPWAQITLFKSSAATRRNSALRRGGRITNIWILLTFVMLPLLNFFPSLLTRRKKEEWIAIVLHWWTEAQTSFSGQ